jgi:hypothetical protein
MVLAAATADMATRAALRPDAGPELLPPQATGRLKHGEQARCPAAMATPATRAGTGAVIRGHCRTVLLWPSAHALQVPDTADALPRPVSARRVHYYRNRSPGRRPLVGCSQRRWTRASRAIRRPRSWPRTEVIAGRVSERASSKLKSSTCSPVASPSCQQPMTAWAICSGSMPTLTRCLGARRATPRSGRP